MSIRLPGIDPDTLPRVAISNRQTVREYSSAPLALSKLGILLWVAQGTRDSDGKLNTPSAGGQYPLQIYVLARNVEELSAGLYYYKNDQHELLPVDCEVQFQSIGALAIGEQPWLNQSAAVMVICADIDTMNKHFADQPPAGLRGERYVYIETGAAAENVQLQACAIGVGMVLVGGFDNSLARQYLQLPQHLEPTALLCLGAL